MRRLYLATLVLAAMPLAAQTDWSKVDVKSQHVAGSVHMITGAGGNIGVSVGEDGLVIVDDRYAPLAPKIEAALAAISRRPVRFVINTHYHGDHTGGNEHFGKGAPIVAHENVRERLASGVRLWGRDVPPAPKGALPVITFQDSVTIHLNGEDLRAVHAPHAHTDGDSVIWFTQSNVVHMGDNFFNGGFPVVDLENGGSVAGMIAVVEKVASMIPSDAKVIPGHGPLGDRDALSRFAKMLRETSAAVSAAIAAGKTVEQVKSENILDPWAEAWGKGFINTERWADILYTDLKSQQ